ncbi:hypothetical protein VSQ32_03395 [Lachnospiraceae bacterium KK002]
MAAEKTAEKKVSSAESAEKAELKKKKLPVESVYSAEELADSAKNMFHTRKECVLAALEAAGKKECTVSEAKKMVEAFLKREVE